MNRLTGKGMSAQQKLISHANTQRSDKRVNKTREKKHIHTKILIISRFRSNTGSVIVMCEIKASSEEQIQP